VLASQIKERLQTISLCDRYTDWMLQQINEWEQEEHSASQSEVQRLTDEIKASEARMEKLVSTYLDSDIPKEIYLAQKDKTMRTTLALRTKLKDAERGEKNWIEPLRVWVNDTKQAAFLSSSTDFSAIRSFVQKIGTNPMVRDKTARFAVPAPSRFIAQRRAVFGFGPQAARSRSDLTNEEVSFCAG